MLKNSMILDLKGLGISDSMLNTIEEIMAKELNEEISNHPRKYNFLVDDLKLGACSIGDREQLIISYNSLTDLPEMTSEKLHQIMNTMFIKACIDSKEYTFEITPVTNNYEQYWWTHFGKFKASLVIAENSSN